MRNRFLTVAALLAAFAVLLVAAGSRTARLDTSKVYVRSGTGVPSICPLNQVYIDNSTGHHWSNKLGSCFDTTAAGVTTPGGSPNQVQYNLAGAFGGFTLGGDCTLTVATGAIVCTKTNGSNFGTAATQNSTAFAASSHTHAEADVTNLVSDLAGKAASVHTHTASQITDFNTAVDARLPVGASGSYNLPPFGLIPGSNISATVTANQVKAIAYIQRGTITINSVHFFVSTLFSGGLCSVGVYNGAGTSKLIDSGAKSTTSTGIQSTTLGSPVTLTDGTVYILAYTCDNATAAIAGSVTLVSNAGSVMNAGTTTVGTTANASASGVLPSALGAISGTTISVPFVKLQN
jgi:hypothetical protein